MQSLNRVRLKKIPFNAEVAEQMYHCLSCKACTTLCEHDIEIPPVLHEARRLAVKKEMTPPLVAEYMEKFHKHNNPYSKDLSKKLKDLLKDFNYPKDSNIVYYASCTTICKCPEIIKDTFELFEKLGIDFVTPYTDPIQCCGYPLLSAGAEYEFVDLAEINFNSLKNYKQIITGSPACAHTLKTKYNEFQFDLEDKVITINQFLEPYLKNINFNVRKNLRHKIMWHDPCFMARYLKDTESPRSLIGRVSGYAPGEFFANRDTTKCSGQSGCYPMLEPEMADAITKTRLAECKDEKINTVVTQCPSCVHKMRKNSSRMVIKDLVSYLNDCIQKGS